MNALYFLSLYFYINMVHDYSIQSNVINQLGQWSKRNQKEIIKKKSKSSQIILPKLCDVMDYITNYKFCHVICNQILNVKMCFKYKVKWVLLPILLVI